MQAGQCTHHSQTRSRYRPSIIGNSTIAGISPLYWSDAEVRLRGRDFVRLCRGYVGGRGRHVLVR